MRFGKSLFSGCKEVDGPEDGWSSQVSGIGIKQIGIGLVVRGLFLSQTQKKKELGNWKHSCLNQYTLCLKMRLMTTIVLQMRMNLMKLIPIMKEASNTYFG